MPWKCLGPQWNVNFPTIKDYQNSIITLHDKMWNEATSDKQLAIIWNEKRDSMIKFRNNQTINK